MTVKGAIFDMDGLLLDSEAQSIYTWPEAGREQGYEITRQMIRDITGTNHVNCRRIMTEYLGADLDFDHLYNRAIDLLYERMLKLNMPLRPYAREILEDLKAAGVKLALGTSTNRDRAMEEMKIAGLDTFFDVFCFGNEVEKGKPAPDIFLLAAERLGIEPSECVVLEDSPNGVLAALAAGMEAIWIPDQITEEDRPDTAEAANYVFPTLKEASAHLTGK